MEKVASGIMMMLIISSVLPLIFNIQLTRAESTWWNSAWIFRRQINITERSGYTLENFPVETSFRHDGHALIDGRDIRVIENDTEIPYYVAKINSTWATIIFELNLTATSTKSIYVYYGNTKAIAPAYPLVSLAITEGNTGHAIIDNRIYVGWDYVAWGAQPGWYIIGGSLVYIDNNPVVLWTDYRMDFDRDGSFEENEDLITDIQSWKGGIGRFHMETERYVERSYGLGDYQRYVRTPIYVDIIFVDVILRIYKGYNFVETTQADRLQMESSLWNYAKYRDGIEENIIDGIGTDPGMWNVMYNSSANPSWMAYRNSLNGYVFGAIAFNTNPDYLFHFPAKETHAYDRLILFDYTTNPVLNPYDQPTECKIYWYADGSNGYSDINKTATMLALSPSVSLQSPEVIPDDTQPLTSHDYDGLWHALDFVMNLTATDDLSGVAETYYKINGGPTKTLSVDGQPLMTIEGSNSTLEYWSIDNAGNEELPHKILTGIKLDKTGPNILITYPSTGDQIKSSNLTVAWTGPDLTSGISRYEVRLDNGSWINVEKSINYTFNAIKDGSHIVDVKATDLAGNAGQDTVSFTVDTSFLFGLGFVEVVAIISIVVIAILGITVYLLKFRKKDKH